MILSRFAKDARLSRSTGRGTRRHLRLRKAHAAAILLAVTLGAPVISAATASASTPVTGRAAWDPLYGDSFYVTPGNNASAAMQGLGSSPEAQSLNRIASQSTAIWLGEWNANNQTTVNSYESDATSKGQVPVFVLYAIPYRDCGSFSAGGYTSDGAYENFVNQVTAGIAGRKAVVIVEPDALPMANSCLNAAQIAERVGLIKYASDTLSVPNTSVYLDAGSWQTPTYIANMLVEADVSRDAGFSINVSAASSTSSMQAYGDAVHNALIADGVPYKHYVIDTSRNGNGRAANPSGAWCNLPGLGLGTAPTWNTSDGKNDAYLWIKYPGQSDGTCTGNGVSDPSAPTSGAFWPAYAVSLANGSSI